MNPRIEKIAKQAGYTPVPGFDFANSLEETFINKFAELIIKECADIALKSGNIANKNIAAKIESERIYHKIKEHFGVEL